MLLDQRACAAGGHAARRAADRCKEFPAFHKCPQESKLRAVSCHSGPAIGTAGEGPEVRPIVLGCQCPARVRASNWCRSQHFRVTPTSRRTSGHRLTAVSAKSGREQSQQGSPCSNHLVGESALPQLATEERTFGIGSSVPQPVVSRCSKRRARMRDYSEADMHGRVAGTISGC
jgi:hypothetical protein